MTAEARDIQITEKMSLTKKYFCIFKNFFLEILDLLLPTTVSLGERLV